MSAEELPLTPPASESVRDTDTRPVSVRIASVSRDGQRVLLVDETGREFSLEIDQRIDQKLPARPTPTLPARRTEVPMESALRPRDIQARIRAGESPETVAEAAGSTVEKIMPFAAPVLAEREHTAERAQKASVRRRPGEPSAVRTLGDAVAARLRSLELEVDAVAWDSYRRHDGRWKLLGAYDLPARSGIAELTYDLPGNYVSLDNDDARWLVGDQLEEQPPAPVRDDLEAARQRRLQPAEPQVTQEPVDEPDPEPEPAPAAESEPTVETPLVDTPVEAYLFDEPTPAAPPAPAAPAPAAQAPAAQAAPAAEQDEAATEPEQPAAPRRTKKKGRASVPSWDEIMFGGGRSD
jgi:hypothetical protein